MPIRRRPAALAVSLSLASALAGAAAPSPSGAGEWKVLFDGTSTAAWRGYRLDSFPTSGWKVEDGTLRTVPAEHGTDLVTRDSYADFELELDWKVGPKGNSGVLYRVAELPAPEPSWHSGPEMQILDDAAYADNPPSTWTGALYDLMAPKTKTVHP